MAKTRVATAALLASSVLGMAVAGSASAAEWFVSGTKLASSNALSTKMTVTTATVLSAPAVSAEIECTSLRGTKPEIVASDSAKASSLVFSGCSVLKPATCKLSSSSIASEPVTAEVSTDSEAEDRMTVSPRTGKTLALVPFEEGTCALGGSQPLKGKVTLGMPTGLEETSEQPIEAMGSLENNSLELGAGNKTYFKAGEAELKLVQGANFAAAGFAGPSWQVEGARLGAGQEKAAEMKLKAGTELKIKTATNELVKINCKAATATGDIVGSAAARVGTDTHKLGFSECRDTLEEGCEIVSYKNKEKEVTAAGTIGPVSVTSELVFPGRVGPRTAGELFIPGEETAGGGKVFTVIELKGEACLQKNKRFSLAAQGPGGPVAELLIAGADAASNARAEQVELRFPATQYRRVNMWMTNFYAGRGVEFRLLNGAEAKPLEIEGTLILELMTKEKFGWLDR